MTENFTLIVTRKEKKSSYRFSFFSYRFFTIFLLSFSPFSTLFAAYPIVICYRLFLHNNKNFTKQNTNLLFAICGVVICIFNYGLEVYHSLIAVTFTYAIINLLYKTRYLVPVSFTFHMSYLLIGNYPSSCFQLSAKNHRMTCISGYYKTSTENYDIKWTMAHCVMVLHLIGLTFDVSDNMKNPEVLAITDDRPVKIPNLLEVFAFAYFPPTVIIGPQFSFKRYNDFLNRKFEGTQNMEHGLKRFGTGVCYLAMYQTLTFIVPDGYFLTDQFNDSNFVWKSILVSIWGHSTLYKYISCWILSEGAAICCGKCAMIF
jgi:lysophospholipid acyltransferase 5